MKQLQLRLTSITVLCMVFFSYSCVPSKIENQELTKYWWKWGSGYNAGDVLTFSNGVNDRKGLSWISEDTIYTNNKPELVVSEVVEKMDGSITLYIESIETGEEGGYHSKRMGLK